MIFLFAKIRSYGSHLGLLVVRSCWHFDGQEKEELRRYQIDID